MSAPATTETFNLTLPVYGPRARHGRDNAYMTREDQVAYAATTAGRVAALIALLQAVSPELAALQPYVGSWREACRFELNGPAVSVRDMVKTGQIEVRAERYGRTQTFRRVKADPKTGAIDPRIVEVVRELVAEAVALVAYEAAAKVRAASDAEIKAAAFAHATTVLASTGLDWAYGTLYNHEGTVNLDRMHSYSARIVGRTMKVELSGVDVDHLPALVAFVKTLTPPTT